MRPFLLSGLLACLFPLASAGAGQPPNVLVIMADDLGYNDLSCYGQKNFQTPALDRMATEGLRFTDGYAGSTVCLPSRCALMTGRDMGHASIRGNGEFVLDPQKENLLPMLMRKAGYRTAMIGKSSVHSTMDATAPNRCGFDHFYGYLTHRQAHNHYPESLWRNGVEEKIEGNQDRQGKHYAEDLVHADARAWITRKDNKPFFLLLSLAVPHADLSAPEDSIAPFRGKFKEVKPPADKLYLSTKEPLATHAAMATRMDKEIGRLLDMLREKGLADQTLVIFTSDNGGHAEGGHHYKHFQSNAPFRGGKRDLYEGGIRVPFLVWWPGTIKPGVSAEPVASWDILPTLAELSGERLTTPTEGRSFATILRGESPPAEPRPLYWEFHEQGGKQAVRLGNWKAIRLNAKQNPHGIPALYDLSKDPGETTDLAAKHPDIVARLTTIMGQRNASGNPAWNFGGDPSLLK
jgi:arylsulfatase A